ITVTLPAGSVFRSADPAVCTAAPAGPTDPVMVTCLRDNFRSGDTFTQQILFQTPTVDVETTAPVTSFLTGKEQANDQNKSHTDTFQAPTLMLTIVPTAGDTAGGCLQFGEPDLATRGGLTHP